MQGQVVCSLLKRERAHFGSFWRAMNPSRAPIGKSFASFLKKKHFVASYGSVSRLLNITGRSYFISKCPCITVRKYKFNGFLYAIAVYHGATFRFRNTHFNHLSAPCQHVKFHVVKNIEEHRCMLRDMFMLSAVKGDPTLQKSHCEPGQTGGGQRSRQAVMWIVDVPGEATRIRAVGIDIGPVNT